MANKDETDYYERTDFGDVLVRTRPTGAWRGRPLKKPLSKAQKRRIQRKANKVVKTEGQKPYVWRRDREGNLLRSPRASKKIKQESEMDVAREIHKMALEAVGYDYEKYTGNNSQD